MRKGRLEQLRDSLFLVPLVRKVAVLLRLLWFVRIRRKLRTIESADAFAVTVEHNLRQLGQCNPRIDLLAKPLSVLELAHAGSRVLIIGPRNEHDLFTFVGNGFRLRNLRGLDLISYSPRIDLGDMHRTPYPDDSWDIVVCGWTLSYSSEPRKVAQEIVRICRDGGLVAIAVEYSTMTEEDELALAGYSIQERDRLPRRVNSVEDILELFGPHVGEVYFRHDAPLKQSHGREGLAENVSSVGVIFSSRK